MSEVSLKKRIGIIAGICVAVLCLVYLGLSLFFRSHFYFRTTINGMDVSGNSVAAVQQKITSNISGYELTITERDGTTETLSGSDFSLVPEFDDSLELLVGQQNGFAWIVKLFTGEELENETLVSYDEEKLKKLMEDLPCMAFEKQVMPEDAVISEYNKEDGYTVIPSVPGTAIDEEAFLQAVNEAIGGLAPELSLADAECYVKPAVGDEDEKLLAAVELLNEYAKTTINYEIGDDVQVLDAETFCDWFVVDDNFKVSIDEEPVSDYVSSLADTYDTYYKEETLNTSYGQAVTISKSRYGWRVDKEAKQAAIIEEIKAGEPVNRDLNYASTANSRGEHDYGNSYVEINLTAQHLFLYKDGELVMETDFVSGDVADGTSTPTGAYGLTYKQKDATLRGANYATPVSFWMPFNGNVGMHDATWRKSFGAAIYKRNGSHGCINLPYSAAKTIYETVSTGYPVLVYELAGTESEAGLAQLAAYGVIDLINAIGPVTLESEPAIVNARAQYEALSDTGKGYVTNYNTLVDAETALANLKAPIY